MVDKRYGFWHDLPESKNQRYLRMFDWFTIVRNPYDRLVSEFYCPFGGRGRPEHPTRTEFNLYLRDRIQRFHRKRGGPTGHYVIQALYLHIMSPSTRLRLVFYERIHELTDLFAEYGISPFPTKHTTRRGALGVQDMDARTVNLVKEIYKADFDAFGYSSRPELALLYKRPSSK